jgi:hypothetical protein
MSFTSLTNDDIQISSDSIVSPLWSNEETVLQNFFTKSNTSSSYLEVYSQNPNTNVNAKVEFSLNYGNISGSGSAPFNPLVPSLTLTKAIYGQIRTLINGDENTAINFGTGNTTSEDVYVINVERARYKEKLFLNTFNLRLRCASGSINLTNNSKDSNTVNYNDAGRVYNIVSGSNGNAISSGGLTDSGSYGKFLPDVGLILLNPKALSLPYASGGIDLSIGSGTDVSTYNNNNNILFGAINSGSYFSLNSEETITSDYFYVRVRHNDYNYTTNPSIINDAGEFYFDTLINDPQTYITTIGLYNDSNELLAVAKTSKPLPKNFVKEHLFKIKLDF